MKKQNESFIPPKGERHYLVAPSFEMLQEFAKRLPADLWGN